MAADDEIKLTADPGPSTDIDFGRPTGSLDQLAALYQLNVDRGDRNTVADSAVSVLDTLQSIGTILKAPLPGESNTLQAGVSNSQFLDEFRSPAYLAERQLDQLSANPEAGFAEGAGEGIQNVLSGGNLIADAAAQVPYLLIGTAAKAVGVAATARIPGVLGKAVSGIAGTGEGAVVNRIAALSGALEGAGGYGQTYQRAIEQGATEAEALDQAQRAGAFSAVLGTVLGRATPGFEISPTGRLAGNLVSNLSDVAGEVVEEGGLAIGQTVFDNILAGKDPMEGVGAAFGEAATISSVFTGAIRAPSVTLDVAKEIGRGVRSGVQAIADRAVTPEQAATAAASTAADPTVPETPEEVIQSTAAVEPAPVDSAAPPLPSTDITAPAAVPPPLELVPEEVTVPEATVPEPSSDRRYDSTQRKAIDALSPEEKDVEIQRLRDVIDNPTDAVTGLIRSDTTGDDANTPVQRALTEAVANSEDQEAHWVSFDVANLGGLNEAVNNVAEDANVHYRALVDIVNTQLADAGLTSRGFRTGGDEFGMLVSGDGTAVESALAKVNEAINAYTVANKLDAIPNPKGKAPGLQLHAGSTRVVPGDTVDTIRNRADRQLDVSKKGKGNVRREQTETPREDARDAGSQEDSGTGSTARPEVREPVEAAPEKAAEVKATPKKERKPLQKKLPLRARRKSRAKSKSAAAETVLANADLFDQIENTTGDEQAALLAKAEELAPFVKKAEAQVDDITDEAVAKHVENAAAGDEQAALIVDAIAATDISRLPDEVLPDGLEPVAAKIRELKDTKVDSTTDQIMSEGFSGRKNSRGIRGYMQDIVNTARAGNTGVNEAATSMARFVKHLTTRAAAFEAALAAPGDNVDVAGTRTRDKDGKLTDQPFIIHKNSANSVATARRAIEDAQRAQDSLDTMKESFPGMFEEDAPVAATTAAAPATPAPTPSVAPVATAPAPSEELSLVEEEASTTPEVDVTEVGTKEEGLFPDQFKMPNSTRIESATGLIDVDMTGDVWKITNTFTPASARKTGAGRARMLQVAKMAAEAGKQLNGDDSVHPDALRMNLRMVDTGAITAEFDRTDVEAAIANNTPLRREGGVFRNIQPVAEQATPAEVVEEVVPVVETAPVAPASGISAETRWVSDVFKDVFKIDGDVSMAQILGQLNEADKASLRRATGSILKTLNVVIAKGVTKLEPRLAEALEKPWGVAAHALIKSGDKLDLQPQIRQALAIAAALHALRAPNKYKEATIIVDGVVNRAATPQAWAREIARDAMLLLGLKPDKDESESFTQGIFLSLGLGAVQAIIDDGEVKLEKIRLPDGRDFNVLIPSAALSEFATDQQGLLDRVAIAMKGEREYGATLEPSLETPDTVDFSDTPISESQTIALQNRQKVPHYMNPTLVSFIQKVDAAGIIRLLTGGVLRKDMPDQVYEVLEAQQEQVKLELKAANHYSDMIGNSTELPLFWQYSVSVNGRTNSILGPQGYKLLRDLFSSARVTLNLNDKAHLDALKMTIAQALGSKTDVQSPEAVLADYDKLVAVWGAKAQALVSALNTSDKVYPLLERGTPYSPRELNGLLTLGQLLNFEAEHKLKRPVDGRTLKLNAPSFESYLAFEIDGKTNGAFNTEMLYGLAEIVPVNLEQGGLMLGQTETSWAAERAKGKYSSKDLYERVARTAIPILRANQAKLLKKYPGLAQSLKDGDILLTLSGMLSKDVEPVFLRDAAKAASNPIVYGAGIGGVANQLIGDMRNNLAAEWLRLDYEIGKDPTNQTLRLERDNIAHWLGVDEETWAHTARAAAAALLEAYKAEKPVVSAVTAMMVKVTNLGYALKQAQWEYAHNLAVPKSDRNQALIAKFGETNAKGQTINKFALSRNEYVAINNGTLSMTFSTAASPVGINLDDTENRPDTYKVTGFGTNLEAPLDLPQPSPPGVRVLALLTQAAGDGAMVNEFMQILHYITDVYDGIEFKATEFMEGGTALNSAVWSTTAHDTLQDFVTVMDRVLVDINGLNDAQKQLVVDAYNSTIPNPDFHIKSFTQFAGEVAVASKKMTEMHEQQLEGRAKLASQPNTMLQMGGGLGHVTEVVDRAAVARADYRKGWNNGVANVFDIFGGTLDTTKIVAMLDTVKWKNPVQAMVWKRLRTLIPAGTTIQLAKNETEWNEMLGNHSTRRPYGSVSGLNMLDGRVFMATTDPQIMLHELMHTVFSGTIGQYFSNINMVPTELRTPINDLVQLLERFKGLNGGTSIQWTQSVIRRLEFVGDTAAAVDEMLTYVMTEQNLIEELSPGFFTRVMTRVKQILWGLVGKDVNSQFLEDAIKTFTVLTETFGINPTVPTGFTRDAINPLEAQTEAAFVAIAQKRARGVNYNTTGVIAQSHLSQIETQYSLSAEQQRLFNRVFMLLRIDSRPGEVEQFVSTTLPHHPQKNLFNGAKDVVASVMALAAVDDTFKAQLEQIWLAQRSDPKLMDQLLDKALNVAQHVSVDNLLTATFSTLAQDAEANSSLLGTVLKRGDRLGNTWLEKIGEKSFQAAQTAPKGVAEVLLGINALTTETGSTAFGRSIIQAANTLTDQRWLQDLSAALVGSQEDTNAVYRQVNEMKSNIAQTRSLFTITLPIQLKKLFPADFDGWHTLYDHFGRLDAQVLKGSAAEMYADDAARRRAITALKAQVNNWVDAENLGYYLAHGTVKPGSAQPLLRNARAIADNLNGAKQKARESLVADVDQLVTLYAIEALSPAERAKVTSYFNAHPDAMANLGGMLDKVSGEDLKAFREEYRYTYWKGNLPLSTDPRTSVVLAGSVKGAALETLGYTKGKKYPRTAGDPATDMHYYTRNYAPPPAFTQGILATVQQTAMGINYTTDATITPEVGTMITSPRLIRYIQTNQGVNSTLSPIFNFEGDVVGYERLLDRKLVQETTKSDNTLLHVAIGQKLGRVIEERMAQRFNEAAIKILTDQWANGQREGEQDQYEAVNSSTDKQVARAWEVIPGATKRALEDAFGGPVMIRKDLLANTLGYHKAGVGDIFTGDASLSENTRRAMFGLTQTIFMGPSGAKVLFAAEQAIKEGVSTAKDWIIVRSMSVAFNNFMSGMNLVLANGVPITELAKSYREGIRDIRTYGRLNREIIELTVKIAGTTDATELKRLRTLQHGKDEAIKRLAIYPLIQAGDLNDLPEGLEEGPSSTYLGDFAGWMNNHLRRIHPKAPMAVANVAIAKDSEFHNAMSKTIQAGDFLGRWAVYKHMVQNGKTPDVARDTVRDEFVSYTTNPGRFRGAMEDFGLVWWSQFTIRAQRILLRRFRRNPFSFFVSQMGAELQGTDGPMDMALTERGWDNSTGLDQVVNAPSAHIWSKLF